MQKNPSQGSTQLGFISVRASFLLPSPTALRESSAVWENSHCLWGEASYALTLAPARLCNLHQVTLPLWALVSSCTCHEGVLQLPDVSIYLSLSSHSKKKKKKHQESTMGNGEVMPNRGAVFCGVRHIWQEEIFPEDTDFGSGELAGSSGLLINIHKNSSLPPLCLPHAS